MFRKITVSRRIVYGVYAAAGSNVIGEFNLMSKQDEYLDKAAQMLELALLERHSAERERLRAKLNNQKKNTIAFDTREDAMSGHKYKIGQTVNYFGPERVSGVYTILQLLPPEGDQFQYRIRNVNELHERVVKEYELGRIA